MPRGPRRAVRVGVLSDTHGLLRPEAVRALRGSDLILHAGDVGTPEVLEGLRALAPVVAVRGNNDRGPWARTLPEAETVAIDAVRVHLVHDVAELDIDPAAEGIAAVVSGHSHRPSRNVRDGVLYLNPGSAGPRRFALPVALARLTVRGSALRVRRIVLAAALLLAAGAARAESGLAVPVPDPLGVFRGLVHDRSGRVIGENVVDNRRREDGRVVLRSEARIEGTAGNLLEAELEPIPDGEGLLRPVWQRTRMPARAGDAVMDLFVDHREGRARCTPPGQETRELPLAAGERVANAVMNLALRPLAAGAVEVVRFEMLLCEGWQPVVGVEARAQARPNGAPVEMRLGFDVGSRALSALLEPFLPDIRVWMRPERPNEWIAHRLPVHRGGPIIAIVREGVDPTPFLPR